MMKRKIYYIAALTLLAGPCLSAQSMDEILSRISANNMELRALREEAGAGAESNLAEAALPDPEFELGYLYGVPEIGNRRDFSVSQSFDFATLTGVRRKNALRKNDLLAIELRTAERDILTSARKLVYEIIYRNAMIEEYSIRAEHAREIERAYKSGLEKGAFSAMDYRKAALNRAEAEGGLNLQKIERDALLTELAMLNGGEPIAVETTSFEPVMLPGSFNEWLDQAGENSSAIGYVRTRSALFEQELKLARTESLPNLSVGYMAELIPGEEFRGITVGISIPLWSSHRKISSARRQLDAARISENNAAMQFRINAEALYYKADQLRITSEAYKSLSSTEECTKELGKALEAGQISLLEYMTELSFCYSARELALSTEKDYMMAVSDLIALGM